jgi:hypothetical protein
MDVGLGIAGLICVAMAAGHTAIGVIWVLPHLREQQLPKTPFGSASTTLAMIRVTWFVVTVFALGTGGVLLTLAWADVDARATLLRWLAAMWISATVMAFFVSPRALRHPRAFARLPVPLLWVIVAALCWTAST